MGPTRPFFISLTLEQYLIEVWNGQTLMYHSGLSRYHNFGLARESNPRRTLVSDLQEPMVTKAKPTASATPASRLVRYGEFMDFFYQVHYRLGMTIEEAMCNGVVSRTQGAVLWLVASEVGDDAQILRKDIERSLREWYETSNSNVSKILRDLASPPLNFLSQAESPHSGREKIVTLTPAGLAFVNEMRERGMAYFEEALAHMSLNDMAHGSQFFSALFSKPVAGVKKAGTTTLRRGGARRSAR